MVEREYSYGIYKYTDNETGNIIYIGKDSHIDKNKRHKEHFAPSAYNIQQINRVLQNNPERYEYNVWFHVDNVEEANQLEFDLINLYRPLFNFYHGGGGVPINKKFRYTVSKSGKTPQGKKRYKINNPDNTPIISSIDYDFIKDICIKLNNGTLLPNNIGRMHINRRFELSKNNSTGFYHVHKQTHNHCKEGFIWQYQYYEDGKNITFCRTDFFNLKKEVERRGLTWHIVDIDRAVDTVRSFAAI